MDSPKVLIVEDNWEVRELLRVILTGKGFEVKEVDTGQEAIDFCEDHPPDVVVLDLTLPDIDGLEVCKRVKGFPQMGGVPIIMCTARGDIDQRIIGLETGADDYLSKPFSNRELLARIKALLRRVSRTDQSAVWKCGVLDVDWDRRTIKIKEKLIPFTPKEFELLKALVESNGRVLSRDLLLQKVWGYEQAIEIQSRTVDLHISQLRQKLGTEGKRVLTVTGAGYRFKMPEEE